MNIYYIGFTGNAGSGKTSVSKYIQNKFMEKYKNSYVLIIPFAKSLKEFAKELGWNGEKDEKGRKLLQLLGTEVGRKCIDENIWVNKWKENVLNILKTIKLSNDIHVRYILILIDDVRFDNEAKYLKELNSQLYMLSNRNHDNVDLNHESEKGINKNYIDKVFDSGNMGLEELQESVYNKFIEYFNKKERENES